LQVVSTWTLILSIITLLVGATTCAANERPQSHQLILHLIEKTDPKDTTKQVLTVQASSADGQPQFTLPGVCEGAWSPQGDALACNTRSQIFIIDTAGHYHSLAEAEQGSIYFWTPAWSPDGTRLAISSVKFGKTIGENLWSLLILSPSSGETISTIALPRSKGDSPIPIMGGFPATMFPQDKLAWSPDGRRILVSWGSAILVEVLSGKTTLLSTNPVMADWDSQGAVWTLEINYAGQERSLNGLFEVDPVTLQRHILTSKEQFDAAGLGLGFGYARLVMSPSRTRLALVVTKDPKDPSRQRDIICIYDIATHVPFDLSKPTLTVESDNVLLLDWSRDEKQLALSHVKQFGATPTITVDVIGLTDGTLTRLSSISLRSMEVVEALAFLKHLAWTH
jgi:WD40 repeat protein